MTWKQYKTWLEANILEEKTILDEKHIVLRSGIAEKYSLGNLYSQEQALTYALANLCLSIEHQDDYSSEDILAEYHTLPPLTDLVEDDGDKVKSWSQLFPSKDNVYFGKIEDLETELDAKTWQVLGQIFEDWRGEEERANKLEEEMNEEKIAKEFVIKTAMNFNYDLLKKGNYESKLTNWLAEYNKLGRKKQKKLAEKKEEVEKMLANLREVFKSRQEQEQQSWVEKVPWMKVIYYGAGVLLVVLIVSWLRSKLEK